MNLEIDEDVKAVAEFMQERIAASRRVSVADGLARLAPLIWDRHSVEEVAVMRLSLDKPISDHDRRTQSCASE